jgi:hypothetical protein
VPHDGSCQPHSVYSSPPSASRQAAYKHHPAGIYLAGTIGRTSAHDWRIWSSQTIWTPAVGARQPAPVSPPAQFFSFSPVYGRIFLDWRMDVSPVYWHPRRRIFGIYGHAPDSRQWRNIWINPRWRILAASTIYLQAPIRLAPSTDHYSDVQYMVFIFDLLQTYNLPAYQAYVDAPPAALHDHRPAASCTWICLLRLLTDLLRQARQ